MRKTTSMILVLLLMCSMFFSAMVSAFAKEYSPLVPGDSGKAVEELQIRLKELGFYTRSCNSKYGTVTKKAVAAFQKANGLPETGLASPQTQRELWGDTAVSSTSLPQALPTSALYPSSTIRPLDSYNWWSFSP